jgi:hypothetical protein
MLKNQSVPPPCWQPAAVEFSETKEFQPAFCVVRPVDFNKSNLARLFIAVEVLSTVSACWQFAFMRKQCPLHTTSAP